MKNTLRINHENKTIVMDRTFAKFAENTRSDEYAHLQQVRRDYTNIPREGEEVFKDIDLKSYTQRVFSMYGGEEKRITLKFITPLLDTVIDRFGTKEIHYSKSDERHFTVTAKVEISNQFFGWLLGFGKKVQIISPPEVRKEFAAYLDKIREMY